MKARQYLSHHVRPLRLVTVSHVSLQGVVDSKRPHSLDMRPGTQTARADRLRLISAHPPLARKGTKKCGRGTPRRWCATIRMRVVAFAERTQGKRKHTTPTSFESSTFEGNDSTVSLNKDLQYSNGAFGRHL